MKGMPLMGVPFIGSQQCQRADAFTDVLGLDVRLRADDADDRHHHHRRASPSFGVMLVGQMLEAQERRTKVTTEADGAYLDGRITGLDRRIDEVVYAAYGLDAADTTVVGEAIEDGAAGSDLGVTPQDTWSELPVSKSDG
jgi:hypothetical protein